VTTHQLRIIQIDSQRLAVFEDDVLTVSDWSEPAPLPFAPVSVLGIVAIEGRMFTVLDLGKEPGAQRTQIVAFRGNEQLALAVDAANEVIQHGDEELQVLNPRSLFATVMKGKERRRRSS
jgi:chemotaxis signal transduction protein